MIPILVALATTASASTPSSSLEEVVAHSRAIVRGQVTGVQTCLNTPQTRAWTFVTLHVDQVLRGQVPGDTMTVRLPAGPLPNNHRGGVLGTPALNQGDRAVLALSARSDGTAGFLPFADMGASVMREVPLGPNRKVVVDGIGRPFHLTTHGPGVGDAIPDLVADLTFGQVFNPAQAASILAPLDGPPLNPQAPPEGPWQGGITLKLAGTIGQEAHSGACEGRLEGDFTQGTLTAYGTCNAPLVGATDLDLYGVWDGQGWSLDLVAAPVSFPGQTRTLHTWVSAPRIDVIAAPLDAADIGGEPVETDGALWLSWRGPKPLLNAGQLVPWIQATSAAHPENAGFVASTPLNPIHCNAAVPVRPLP